MTFAEAIPLLLQGKKFKRKSQYFYKAEWATWSIYDGVLCYDETPVQITKDHLEATDWEVIE